MIVQSDIFYGLSDGERSSTFIGQAHILNELLELKETIGTQRAAEKKRSVSHLIHEWENKKSIATNSVPTFPIPLPPSCHASLLSTPSPVPRSESSYGSRPSSYGSSEFVDFATTRRMVS